MSFKKIRRDQKNKENRALLSGIQAPILVKIMKWYPAENAATVQIIRSEGLANYDVGDTKFPFLGPGHVNISANSIVAGETVALLYFTGTQIKKGYLQLAHDEGGDRAVTYAPIRFSWGVN